MDLTLSADCLARLRLSHWQGFSLRNPCVTCARVVRCRRSESSCGTMRAAPVVRELFVMRVAGYRDQC